MRVIQKLLIGSLVSVLVACSSGSSILKQDVAQTIGNREKRTIRCYVMKKNDTVLVDAVIEGCQLVFNVVESRPYDIKIVPEISKYNLKTLKERCKYTRSYGGITCYGTYRVDLAATIEIYDARNTLIKKILKSDGETVETYAMASGHRNNKKVSQARAHRNAAGNANVTIMNRIIPDIIMSVYSDDQVIAIEKKVLQNPKGIAMARTKEQKVPFTCVLSLPAGFESATTRALFQRSYHINKEKQAGTVEVNIGNDLKNVLVEKLKKEFSQIQVMGVKGESLLATYNPHNVACIIKFDYQNTVVESQSNSVSINASASFETPTGEVYKTADLTGHGTAMLKKGGGFMSKVLTNFSLTRVFTEGHYTKKALQNGCDEAIIETAEKLVAAMDPNFVTDFSEYAAYSAAKQSNSANDIQHFLSIYPQSRYATELNTLMDDVLYEFAVGTDSVEGYMDYLDKLPQGKNRLQAEKKIESLVYEQIVQGNVYFCDIYFKYNLSGVHRDAVTKACANN